MIRLAHTDESPTSQRAVERRCRGPRPDPGGSGSSRRRQAIAVGHRQ